MDRQTKTHSQTRFAGNARFRRRARIALSSLLGWFLVVASSSFDAAAQQEADAQPSARNCIVLANIDRTSVVDDDTILFHMRDGSVYRNDLTTSCPTLGRDPFMYRVATPQLCEIDVVTTLNDVGFGYMPGASCSLGEFELIDGEAAQDLLAETDADDAR
jgi:hypothetical protein